MAAGPCHRASAVRQRKRVLLAAGFVSCRRLHTAAWATMPRISGLRHQWSTMTFICSCFASLFAALPVRLSVSSLHVHCHHGCRGPARGQTRRCLTQTLLQRVLSSSVFRRAGARAAVGGDTHSCGCPGYCCVALACGRGASSGPRAAEVRPALVLAAAGAAAAPQQ